MKVHISISLLFKTIILSVFVIYAAVVAFLSNIFSESHIIILTVLNLLQTVIIVLYCVESGKLKERFAFFSFNIAYLVLLQGSYISNIGNTSFYGRHIFSSVVAISYENETKGLFYILLAQAITFIAYGFSSKKISSQVNTNTSFDVNIIRNWCITFMILGGAAAFLKVGLKVIYVARYGYLATYLATGNALYQNTFIDLFDKFYYLGFYGYLATFPKLKKLKVPMVFFAIYSILTLLTGIRGEIVINTLFIVWYFSKRDEFLSDSKVILSKKRVIILGLLGLISFAFLYDFGISRFGKSVETSNLISKIFGFLNSQGGSGRLTALGLQYRDKMILYISPFMMAFSPVRNFIINNSIVRLFTGGVLGQNISSLSRAGSFDSVLTFITNESAYFNGSGLGTSYVAELAVSYGAIGIIIFGLILGKLFYKIDHIKLSNWPNNVLWMNAFIVLTYIPRHAALQIIPESVSAILFVLLVSMLSMIKQRRYQ